jgi:hypothetical protein
MDQQTSTIENNKPGGLLKQIEDFLYTYLHTKVPFHLPPSVKEFIVKFGPWIDLVLMVLALPFAAVYGATAFSTTYLLGGIVTLIAFIMQAVALPGLFARSIKGWHLLYYATLITLVGRLISFDIVGAIIGAIISLYVLFEIREYYK